MAARLTLQIPATTYTNTLNSNRPLRSYSPALPGTSSRPESSLPYNTIRPTYPYSYPPPPSPSSTDSDSMLSLEYADALSSPMASSSHGLDSSGLESSSRKSIAENTSWGHGPTLSDGTSSTSRNPRVHHLQEPDPDSTFTLPNPHSLPLSFANSAPYPRTPSASSSTSSKSVSSASTKSNSSSVTSASSTNAAELLKLPASCSSPRTPSPLGERRGKTPSPLQSNGVLSTSRSARQLAHRTSSPSPLSASFSLTDNGNDNINDGLALTHLAGSSVLPNLLANLAQNEVAGDDSGLASNSAARPSPVFLVHDNANNSLGRPGMYEGESNQVQTAMVMQGMQRSESPLPLLDLPKPNDQCQVRLVGRHRDGSESLQLAGSQPGLSPTKSMEGSNSQLSQQPAVHRPRPTSSQYPRSQSVNDLSSNQSYSLAPSDTPVPRPHSRNGTRLPVPPTLIPSHHRNSSSTSLISSMAGFTGGVSGGMAGNRPLSGSISDLTFGGPGGFGYTGSRSPSRHSQNSPPRAYMYHPGQSQPQVHPRPSTVYGQLPPARKASGSESVVSYGSWGYPGVSGGIEHQRTGASTHSQGQSRNPSRRHSRQCSNGSWIPASAFEGAGPGSEQMLSPPPGRSGHRHARSHSYDGSQHPQPARRDEEKEDNDDTIYTGFGGVGRPTPSPTSSPVKSSFSPISVSPQASPNLHSRPLPIPRHSSRTSFVSSPRQRPYSAIVYSPSQHLPNQSTGGLSILSGFDPAVYLPERVGVQSTGSTSCIGPQDTGTGSSTSSSLPPAPVVAPTPSPPPASSPSSSPAKQSNSRKLTKSLTGSPTKAGGGGGFKLFSRKKESKGIVNGDGMYVSGVVGGSPQKDKRSSSPLKKLGLSFRSLSPKKTQKEPSPTKQPGGLIWSSS